MTLLNEIFIQHQPNIISQSMKLQGIATLNVNPLHYIIQATNIVKYITRIG